MEVVASLALKLDREGHAVGLVTNGVLTGGGSSLVSVARSHRQVPAILEVLARLEMESRLGVLALMRSGMDLPWGISCAYFAYTEDRGVAAAEEYFTYRKTPVVFFVSRGAAPGKDRPKLRRAVRRIEDLAFQEKDRQ